MPPGHNGPYRHQETPVRNTAHWLFTWVQLYARTNHYALRRAANAAVDYLISTSLLGPGPNWKQRNAAGRDECNGVIGAAWVVEALAIACEFLERRDAFEIAEQVFMSHLVNSKTLLWHRLLPNGQILSVDRTLNHQLWFAAAGARLAAQGSPGALEKTLQFLDHLPNILSIRSDGMIHHRIQLHWWDRAFEADRIGYRLHRKYVRLCRPGTASSSGFQRDVGYHAYNLHALATLRRHMPDHPFWVNGKLKRALQFTRTEAFEKANNTKNPYSIPYNPVGFEMAWVLETFYPDQVQVRKSWLEFQFSAIGAPEGYGLQALDPRTTAARIYEASELEDISLFEQ